MRRHSSVRCCCWATAWGTRSSCRRGAPAGPARSSITRDVSSRAPRCAPGSRTTARCRCAVSSRCCATCFSPWRMRIAAASPTATCGPRMCCSPRDGCWWRILESWTPSGAPCRMVSRAASARRCVRPPTSRPSGARTGGAGWVLPRQWPAVARGGWRPLPLDHFAERLQSTQSETRNPQSAILVPFDDGSPSLALHAYPVLAALGFTATTFLITDFVGRANTWDMRYTWHRLPHLDWDAIERWHGRGLEFASHTASHARLTWLSDGRVADELGRSRETLLRRLGGTEGRAVAYPFGALDERIERLARAAGYELGFGGVEIGRAHV